MMEITLLVENSCVGLETDDVANCIMPKLTVRAHFSSKCVVSEKNVHLIIVSWLAGTYF